MLASICPILLLLSPLFSTAHPVIEPHKLYPRQNETAVARAGGVLNAAAAAEANPVDNTAVKAFAGASLKSADGQCLFIDPTAGDFRENLIPVALKACDGSAGQKFDIVTSGKHVQGAGNMLVVSTVVSFNRLSRIDTTDANEKARQMAV